MKTHKWYKKIYFFGKEELQVSIILSVLGILLGLILLVVSSLTQNGAESYTRG